MKQVCAFCGAEYRAGKFIEPHWSICFGNRYEVQEVRDVADDWLRTTKNVVRLPAILFSDEVKAMLAITK